jgi:hypothetical protein
VMVAELRDGDVVRFGPVEMRFVEIERMSRERPGRRMALAPPLPD